MLPRAIIYLARPRVTRSFDVQVTGEDPASAELTGAEVIDADLMLKMSSGMPRFDVEFCGRLYRECRLSAMRTHDSIPFTFERVRDVDASSAPDSASPKSDS